MLAHASDIGLGDQVRVLLPIALAGGATWGVVRLVLSARGEPGLTGLVLGAGAGGLTYLAVLALVDRPLVRDLSGTARSFLRRG
jgi:hypothetical protein